MSKIALKSKLIIYFARISFNIQNIKYFTSDNIAISLYCN